MDHTRPGMNPTTNVAGGNDQYHECITNFIPMTALTATSSISQLTPKLCTLSVQLRLILPRQTILTRRGSPVVESPSLFACKDAHVRSFKAMGQAGLGCHETTSVHCAMYGCEYMRGCFIERSELHQRGIPHRIHRTGPPKWPMDPEVRVKYWIQNLPTLGYLTSGAFNYGTKLGAGY